MYKYITTNHICVYKYNAPIKRCVGKIGKLSLTKSELGVFSEFMSISSFDLFSTIRNNSNISAPEMLYLW